MTADAPVVPRTERTVRSRQAVAIDVGGTSIAAALVDVTTHELVSRHIIATPRDASLLATALGEVVEVLADGSDPIGIGIGIPGIVDPFAGTVRRAVNLGIGAEPVPLAAAVTSLVHLDVRMENDTRAATLGAARVLAPEHADVAVLTMGTGVAAGFVLDGRIHRGPAGMAGEIGHANIGSGGRRCSCGSRGCLESSISGPAIRAMWPEGGDRAAEALFHAAAGPTPDTRAVRLADQVAEEVARTVQLIVLMSGVEKLFLWGAVGSVGRPLVDRVRGHLDAWGVRSPLAQQLCPGSRLGDVPGDLPLGLLGASMLVGEAPRG